MKHVALKYFGNNTTVNIAKQYLMSYDQPDSKKAILLTGPPGVGKTYLTAYLADMYGAERWVINASDDRTKDAIRNIVSVVSIQDVTIVVLDECEGMKSKDIIRIISSSRVPLFLCCNFIDAIDKSVQALCTVVKLEQPQWYDIRDYMLSEIAANRLPQIDSIDLEMRARRAKSFRHAARLIDDPDDPGIDDIDTKYTQVEKVLRGEHVEKINMDPKELLTWINDNVDIPELTSSLDLVLEHAYLADYHHWSYVYGALNSVRSRKRVEYPRSFRLMATIKRERKTNEATTPDGTKSNIKVDLSNINVEQINKTLQAGKSLFDGLDIMPNESLTIDTHVEVKNVNAKSENINEWL